MAYEKRISLRAIARICGVSPATVCRIANGSEDFSEKTRKWVADIHSQEYYVNMMRAWFFATALAKQWNAAIPYVENRSLAPWVHSKTIQKAVESYRITPEQKAYLRTWK